MIKISITQRKEDRAALQYIVDCIKGNKKIKVDEGSHRYIVEAKEKSKRLLTKSLKSYEDHIESITEIIATLEEVANLKKEIEGEQPEPFEQWQVDQKYKIAELPKSVIFKEGGKAKSKGQIYSAQKGKDWVMAIVTEIWKNEEKKEVGKRTMFAIVTLETLNKVLQSRITHREALNKTKGIWLRDRKEGEGTTFYNIPKSQIPQQYIF